MKTIFFSCFLLLFALTGSTPADAQANNRQSQQTSVDEMLIANEKQTWELYKNRDVKSLGDFTSEDFYDIYVDGQVVNKEQYLKDVFEIEVKSYSLSDFKVIMLSDDARLVVYQARAEGRVRGREIKSHVAVTSAWARRGGKWLNVFYRENIIELNGRKAL